MATFDDGGKSVLELLRQWDPQFAEAYTHACTDPWTNGILPRKTIELLCVAVNVACTHLQTEGTRRHVRAALEAGATKEELLAVIELASLMAVHACSVGAPLLVEEAHAVGAPLPQKGGPTPASDRMRATGNWNTAWNPFYDLDPAWTDHVMAAGVRLYDGGALGPRGVELVSIALDAAVTHLYTPGLRRHIRAALALGVTPEEVMEVLKVCVACGAESLHLGLPILAEELDAFAARAGKKALAPA